MKRWFFVPIVLIIFIFSGCTVPPPSPSSAPQADEESGKLPGSYGPLGKNHKSIQMVNEVFLKVENLRKAERFTESELQSIRKVSRFVPIVVSGCDLEVLKTFVVRNWAPVIVTRSPVGPKHVRMVIGYDDSAERVTLIEPMVYTPAVISYEDFSKQWDDLQKTCLLMFSENIGKQGIENALRRYLPADKIKSLRINTPNVTQSGN